VLAKESDPRVREMTAWALGQIEQRTGSPALQRALREDADDGGSRDRGVGAAQMEDRTAIDALVAALGDRSGRVRGTGRVAPRSDGRRGHARKAPAALTRLLKDDSEDVRRKAAWALGNVGDPSAVAAIRDAMRVEQSSEVRRALVRALTKSGGPLGGGVHRAAVVERSEGARGGGARSGGQNAFNPWPMAVAASPAVPVSAPMLSAGDRAGVGARGCCGPATPAGDRAHGRVPTAPKSCAAESIRAGR
jgi:HEAT repeat protein